MEDKSKEIRCETQGTIEFDNVFDEIGHFGLIQKFIYLFVGILCFISGAQNLASSFLAADIPHWCRITELQNYSFDEQRYISIPYIDDHEDEDDYDDKFESCDMFQLHWSNYTDENFQEWDRDERTDGAATQSCIEGWLYNQDHYKSTIVNEWELICDDTWIVAFSTTLYMSGIFFGSVIAGYISDKYGRRTAYTYCNILHLVSAIAATFSPNIVLYTIARFFVSVSVNGALVVGIVITTELIGPKHRSWATLLYMLYFPVGYVSLAGVAIFVRDYKLLQLIFAVTSVPVIFIHWLLPESPRWLLTQNRYKEASDIIQHMATINNKIFSEDLKIILTENPNEDTGKVKDLFSYTYLRKVTISFFMIWFVTALSYYGVSINLGELTGSIYMNILIAGVVEVLADITTVPMVNHKKIGRRLTARTGLLIGGLGMLSSVPFLMLEGDWEIVAVVLIMIGKYGVTVCYTSLFLYTTEVFPTAVRNLALGGCSMVSGVGTTIAPYFGNPLNSIWTPLPNIIIGGFALVGGILTLFLPETLGSKIPDTIEESEEMARTKGNRIYEQ